MRLQADQPGRARPAVLQPGGDQGNLPLQQEHGQPQQAAAGIVRASPKPSRKHITRIAKAYMSSQPHELVNQLLRLENECDVIIKQVFEETD